MQLTKRDTLYATVQAARENGAAVLAFGAFANAVIKFLIVAFAVFLLIEQFNNPKRMLEKQEARKPATPVPPPADVLLSTEIRDLPKARA